jgi:hypothetical protein
VDSRAAPLSAGGSRIDGMDVSHAPAQKRLPETGLTAAFYERTE